MYLIIVLNTSGYESVWIIGDKFVQDSRKFLSKFWNLDFVDAEQDEDSVGIPFTSYISEQYEIQIFDSKDTCIDEVLKLDGTIRTVLGRIRNAIVYALNKFDKLLKYILLVMDDDIIHCVNFNKPGCSEIFGRDLNWLANKFHDVIFTRKNDLPKKARRYLFPQVFWVLLPIHKDLETNQMRVRFNQCVEAVVECHKEMKPLKIHRHWDYQVSDAVVNNLISSKGIHSYWAGVDEALEFWENGRCNRATARDFNTKSNTSKDGTNSMDQQGRNKNQLKWLKNKAKQHTSMCKFPY